MKYRSAQASPGAAEGGPAQSTCAYIITAMYAQRHNEDRERCGKASKGPEEHTSPQSKATAFQSSPTLRLSYVPTPASKDLQVQQGQTAGLDPGMKLRVRSQFMSGGLAAWRVR